VQNKATSAVKTLEGLITDIGLPPVPGSDVKIVGITADSREVRPGFLFVAVQGGTVDGHKYVGQAVEQGCVAVLVQQGCGVSDKVLPVPVVSVKDSRLALAELAASFHGHPELDLKIIGLTGTNGKTTSSYLLESIIRADGKEPGVIGTVNYRFCGEERPAPHTTPEPIVLFDVMRQMVDCGVSHLIMEVSSHALSQERLHGLYFDIAVFTNLSRDHLDFHSGMEEYFAAKKKLFTEHLKPEGVAVIVVGEDSPDVWGDRLARELLETGNFTRYSPEPAKSGESFRQLLTCGTGRGDVQAAGTVMDLDGIKTELYFPGGRLEVISRLVGDFNLQNILAAVSVGYVLGLERNRLADGVTAMETVPGRLERVSGPPGAKSTAGKVFVDYAHTPEALAGVLTSLRRLNQGRLITVFGCGGDRDRGKRSIMGEIAGRLSDVSIVTTDNPRTESPEGILADIVQGIKQGCPQLERKGAEILLNKGRRGYDVIPSRKEAIRVAVSFSGPDDVVLISGKGHEDYQIVGRQRHFFDDRLEAGKCLAAMEC